jgi:hypothetical protein
MMRRQTKRFFGRLLGVNLINALQASFTHSDHKSAKKTVNFFVLLASAHAKAACRRLMNLTLVVGSLDCIYHSTTGFNCSNTVTVYVNIFVNLKLSI